MFNRNGGNSDSVVRKAIFDTVYQQIIHDALDQAIYISAKRLASGVKLLVAIAVPIDPVAHEDAQATRCQSLQFFACELASAIYDLATYLE